jgi:hypothetical protein
LVSVGLSLVACGDDDDSVKDGENAATAEGGSAAKSGNGGAGKAGATAGKSGSGAGRGGSSGKPSGSSGSSAGSAPTGPGGMMLTCEEEPGTDPVKCGGQTCEPAVFGMNTCIIACCVELNGKEQCGSKSTATGFTSACSLPAVEDAKCPDLSDTQGGMLKGCCNVAQKKCGIVSTLRPGCITDSTYVTYPEPLADCTPPSTPATGGDKGTDKGTDKDTDAGAPDDKDAG